MAVHADVDLRPHRLAHRRDLRPHPQLRGANPLAIYLLAFLPSIACVLLISGGEQMLKEATSAAGVLVCSSGNLGIAAMIAIAYRQVARN